MVVAKPRSKKPKIEASIRIPETNWFKEILDVATEKGQVLWNEPVKYHRASAVGDPCIRSLALNMLGYNSLNEPFFIILLNNSVIVAHNEWEPH